MYYYQSLQVADLEQKMASSQVAMRESFLEKSAFEADR